MQRMTYKIYVTDQDEKRLKIFVQDGDVSKPQIDHTLAKTLQDALYIVRTLQRVIDECNRVGGGALKDCTVHMQVIQ